MGWAGALQPPPLGRRRSWQPGRVAEEEGGPEALAWKKSGGTPHGPLHPAPTEDIPVPVGSAPSPLGEASGSQKQLGSWAREGEATKGRGHLAKELEEAVLTVRLVVLLLEGALVELLEAEGTDEMLRVELLGHGSNAAACDGLLAAGAQRTPPLMIVHLTVGLPIVLKEAAIDKRCEAFPAHKALRVPEGVEGRNVVLQDGPGTAATFGGEHVKVILPAIGLAIFLMEPFGTKEGSTLGTEEVLRVPRSVKGCHHFIQDGAIAVVAAWREEVVIVLFTVGLSIPLKEVPGSNLLLAVGADEMLWVPRLPHGGHNLPSNGLLAGPADTLGNCGNTQFVQVRLQAPQHAI